jgi:hypothetical protein
MSSNTDAFAAALSSLEEESSADMESTLVSIRRDTKDIDPRDALLLRMFAEVRKVSDQQNNAKESRDNVTRTFEGKLNQLSNGGVSPEEKAMKRRFWKKIGGALGTVAAIVAGGTGYWVKTAPPKPPEVNPADVKVAVEESSNDLEQIIKGDPLDPDDAGILGKVDGNIEKLDWLHERAEEQQVQISDSTEFLGDKLDAISLKASKVKKPATLQQAKDRADRIKAAKREEALFEGEKDPFKK